MECEFTVRERETYQFIGKPFWLPSEAGLEGGSSESVRDYLSGMFS